MGTRAMTRVGVNDFVMTHWDGNPESLGSELRDAASRQEILDVLQDHEVDYNYQGSELATNGKTLETGSYSVWPWCDYIYDARRAGNILKAPDGRRNPRKGETIKDYFNSVRWQSMSEVRMRPEYEPGFGARRFRGPRPRRPARTRP